MFELKCSAAENVFFVCLFVCLFVRFLGFFLFVFCCVMGYSVHHDLYNKHQGMFCPVSRKGYVKNVFMAVGFVVVFVADVFYWCFCLFVFLL